MATIEERASMFGLSHTKHIADSIRPQAVTRMHDLYKEIATEQKEIDEDHLREVKKMVIDKACRWLKRRYPIVNTDDLRNALKG